MRMAIDERNYLFTSEVLVNCFLRISHKEILFKPSIKFTILLLLFLPSICKCCWLYLNQPNEHIFLHFPTFSLFSALVNKQALQAFSKYSLFPFSFQNLPSSCHLTEIWITTTALMSSWLTVRNLKKARKYARDNPF